MLRPDARRWVRQEEEEERVNRNESTGRLKRQKGDQGEGVEMGMGMQEYLLIDRIIKPGAD